MEDEDENESPGTPTRGSRDVRPDAIVRKPSRKEIKELKEKEKEVAPIYSLSEAEGCKERQRHKRHTSPSQGAQRRPVGSAGRGGVSREGEIHPQQKEQGCSICCAEGSQTTEQRWPDKPLVAQP